MRPTCELHPSLPLTFLCHHKATHLHANRIEMAILDALVTTTFCSGPWPFCQHFSISEARKMQKPRAHEPLEFC